MKLSPAKLKVLSELRNLETAFYELRNAVEAMELAGEGNLPIAQYPFNANLDQMLDSVGIYVNATSEIYGGKV